MDIKPRRPRAAHGFCCNAHTLASALSITFTPRSYVDALGSIHSHIFIYPPRFYDEHRHPAGAHFGRNISTFHSQPPSLCTFFCLEVTEATLDPYTTAGSLAAKNYGVALSISIYVHIPAANHLVRSPIVSHTLLASPSVFSGSTRVYSSHLGVRATSKSHTYGVPHNGQLRYDNSERRG